MRATVREQMPHDKVNIRPTDGVAHVTRSFRLPRAHEVALKELAAREHRTFSSELRRLVEQRIAEDDQMEAA